MTSVRSAVTEPTRDEVLDAAVAFRVAAEAVVNRPATVEDWMHYADAAGRLHAIERAVRSVGNASPEPPGADAPEWATVAQVAARFGMGQSTIRRYVRDGILPAHRLVRNVRLDVREVDRIFREAGMA